MSIVNKFKNIFCTNCGKSGHEYRHCNDPITSWGIILVDITNEDNTHGNINHVETNLTDHNIGIKPKNLNELKLMSHHMNSIKFLLIRRKHSLGFVEFMRGRYKPDNVDGITYIFQQMTSEEIDEIGNSNFDKLWSYLWSDDNDKITLMKREYELSKAKFDNLLSGKGEFNIELKLDYFIKNVKPTYKNREWGFPKGRRTRNESELECALREFSEETGIDSNDIKVIKEIKPIQEIMTGTDGVKYRHIYYVAETLKPLSNNIKENINELKEVSYVDFFNFYDAYTLIRDYHIEKKNILTCLFMYYIENIMDVESKKSIENILSKN